MESELNWPSVKLSAPFVSKERATDIVVVVVTYNRKEMLFRCIDLLLGQTAPCDIMIVDNASTDGTRQALATAGLLHHKKIHYIHLNQNTGGAGGFYFGAKYAIEKGWYWFWLMDDDAEPHRDALEKLQSQSRDQKNIYGSAAINIQQGKARLCFGAKRCNPNGSTGYLDEYDLLEPCEKVAWLPFLGFFIHRNTVSKIGLPDRDFFIRNDDIEYAERAKRRGAGIYLIKESIIEHPFQPTVKFMLLGRPVYHRKMPAWKIYYEVRNKLILWKRYYSLLAGLRLMSGVTLQVIFNILTEKDKTAYIKSYFQGLLDGIAGNPKIDASISLPARKTDGSTAV